MPLSNVVWITFVPWPSKPVVTPINEGSPTYGTQKYAAVQVTW